MPEHHSLIIIGAGLSGLHAAWQLQQQNTDVLVLEARDRAGGRILSIGVDEQAGSRVDLGPAWVWPSFQPRLRQLINDLDLTLFKQYTQGDLLYEIDAHTLQRHPGPSSHNQSYRLVGGAQSLTDALLSRLTDTTVSFNSCVTSIDIDSDQLTLQTLSEDKPRTFCADRIILALPPRVCHNMITFNPPLDIQDQQAWQNTPTWMAAHSKAVFVYQQPFWREQGLSGEVFSRYGPLTEIYDASPANESCYALTSFVGLTAPQRQQLSDEQLQTAYLAQLERLFGEKSQQVTDILTQDWSQQSLTTVTADLQGPAHHPQYPHNRPRSYYQDRVFLAGTEAATEQGGYLEGALESAEDAILWIKGR